MGKVWCAGFPVVTVPRRDTPKRVTYVYPYYNNPEFLRYQIEVWSATHRQHVSAIVVDDGSPIPATLPSVTPFPMRLFRIDVDVRWNWLAARNIGAHHAEDGWLLMTDMDHVVHEATHSAIVFGHHDPDVVYAFRRIEHNTGKEIAPHSASFLMTREMFWRIGGYDERLSGFYGTDGEYRRRVARVAPIHVLNDTLVRYEYFKDSSTTDYKRKQPEDAAVKQLIAARGKGWRPKVLSFPYREVC